MNQKPLFVVVHGVGDQARLGTLRAFVEGLTSRIDIPPTLSRAMIAESLDNNLTFRTPELPYEFAEFHYAGQLQNHQEYAEQDPRVWIRSIRNQLREINHRRHGPENADFAYIERVLEDALMATALLRMGADRLHVNVSAFNHAAVGFLQQVQLYADRTKYRSDIAEAFRAKMAELTLETDGSRHIVIVSHSLGTVVALRALLDAAHDNLPWLNSVRMLATFGSPIDLLLLLFPDLFAESSLQLQPRIRWVNYTFSHDPIASDLAVARGWLKNHAPGIFEENSPDEVLLGRGTLVAAHTDYWHEWSMYADICEIVGSSTPSSNKETRPEGETPPPATWRQAYTLFRTVYLCIAAIVAWLIIIWWEENLKSADNERVILMGNPLSQLALWLGLWLMIVGYINCWSITRSSGFRLVSLLLCVVTAAALILSLPGIPLFGGMLGDVVSDHDPLLPPDWKVGNLMLGLVPLCAAIGACRSREHRRVLRTPHIIGMLASLAVFLAICVGTRDNPSNVAAEFGLLALLFGGWWLSILVCRMHDAFSAFVGGRIHLNILSEYWKMDGDHRDSRHPNTSSRKRSTEKAVTK